LVTNPIRMSTIPGDPGVSARCPFADFHQNQRKATVITLIATKSAVFICFIRV
jgi:hypothetical protein